MMMVMVAIIWGGLLICDYINSVHPPKVEIISQKASYLTK